VNGEGDRTAARAAVHTTGGSARSAISDADGAVRGGINDHETGTAGI